LKNKQEDFLIHNLKKSIKEEFAQEKNNEKKS